MTDVRDVLTEKDLPQSLYDLFLVDIDICRRANRLIKHGVPSHVVARQLKVGRSEMIHWIGKYKRANQL